MAGPFDYTIQQSDPFKSVMTGYETGVILNERDRQRAAEQAQAQAQAEQQAQIQRIQQSYYTNPKPSYQDFMQYAQTLDPKVVEPMLKAFQASGAEGQRQSLQTLSQVGSALRVGDGVSAAKLMRQSAEAYRNAGDTAMADAAEVQAKIAEKDPAFAMKAIVPTMSILPGGAEAIKAIFEADKTQAETGKVSAEAQEAGSKALSAATAAKFAESKAVLDLRMGEAQIQKMAADSEIARMNARIAAMNAATSREGNTIKKQENQLKLQEMIDKRDEKVREKVATVESGRTNIDNMLNTVDRVLKNPALNDVLGSFEGRMPAAASMLDDQESDAIALIDTLGSQSFLAQIPNIKGMGALSNAEGEKLQSALQNLNRSQSEKQFKANLSEAQRLLIKSRKNLSTQYGVPDTAPDRPAAQAPGIPAGFKILGKE